MKQGLRIYNLFPRLLGPMPQWIPAIQEAADMGFNCIYVNPFHYVGFSGSLYAVSDYYRFNPLFLSSPDADGIKELRSVIDTVQRLGMTIIMDLVINHTAIDSPLTKEHPEWYVRTKTGKIKSPSAIDPANASKVTVWGDLGEIDNEHSSDREALWTYWEKLVTHYLEIGFDGFRCDAAYQVPPALWSRLMEGARKIKKDVIFIAETLGCREQQTMAIAQEGFSYICNSSKWWNFKDSWCLDQYKMTRKLVPSISFPETHDTPRLAKETEGKEHVSKMRYLFAAIFSQGLLMPLGYEKGFKKKSNVVRTTPDHMEEGSFDISDFIRRTNQMKAAYPILNQETYQELIPLDEHRVVALRKINETDGQVALVIINRSTRGSRLVHIGSLKHLGGRDVAFQDISPEEVLDTVPDCFEYQLAPAEIKVLLSV